MGINVLCEIVSDEDAFVISKPVAVLSQQGQNGQTMVAFTPFLEYCDEFSTGITIRKDDVLTVNTPNIELKNQYSKIFGSGIQIASADVLK